MPDSKSRQDKVLVSEANDTCGPAQQALPEGSVAPEQPSQRVAAHQYLEALRQGVMLSS